VGFSNRAGPGEIGDGTRHPSNPIVSATRYGEAFDGGVKQSDCLRLPGEGIELSTAK
jgi:hypothetical protein